MVNLHAGAKLLSIYRCLKVNELISNKKLD
jgi:hypothetical protein